MRVSLVVLALCAIVSVAKAQPRLPNKADSGSNNNAARFGPKQLSSSSESCPPADQREAIRLQVLQEVRSLLRNDIAPGLMCQMENTQQLPANSCNAILAEGCISGYYWLNVSGGAVRLYCDMDRRFLNSTEVWTRIAYLNMTDPTQNCPSGWREVLEPKRTCRRSLGSQSNSAIFRTYGMNYTRVCGRIIGYQLGTPEAFAPINYNPQRNWSPDDYYMDGVSVTYGPPGGRMHIWSFAGALSENHARWNNCPCTNSRNTTDIAVPPFIGSDYFCETGTLVGPGRAATFFSNDPLWDGKGCGIYSSCCTFNNPPWFCKQLPEATTEDIEVRLLTAASPANFEREDTPVELIELYIQQYNQIPSTV